MSEMDLTESVRRLISTGTALDLAQVLAREFSPSRDLVAAMAMQGCLAGDTSEVVKPDDFAAYCYSIADAMIAARRSSREGGR